MQPAILMNQEYEADLGAFQITLDLNSAITCLTKLVGGHLELPSHIWELRDIEIPAMTMSQRISELKQRIASGGPNLFL